MLNKRVVAVAVLWGLVLVSALAVVSVSHKSRSRLDQLEVLRREAAQLHVDWGRYLLEQSTWSAYGRIEAVASEKLNMTLPQGEQLVMVKP
ncbi:cell division protein FtsL [Candidatus Pelagadaptatus aseana]|uniref:cell division protein FtsL n=1 Tax=Candidatus Pelagadaptatus aseana TaxID=3120508 RepID=UPI003C6F1A15